MKTTALLLLSALAAHAEPSTVGTIVSHDPSFDKLVAPGTKIEVLGSGFNWSEGPVWEAAANRLLFSDVPENTIFQWTAKDGIGVYMKPSGFTGPAGYGREPGSNGLAFDKDGRLLCCEHGDRRVSVLTKGGGKRTLADNYQGKRFNSPNDLVVHKSGAIFFTDPPYGLPKGPKDPTRELDFCGVFRLDPNGTVTVVDKTLERPNGIALSPDHRTLYVAQSHGPAPHVVAWPLGDDLSPGRRRVVFDASDLSKQYPGAPDGLKVDTHGNIWTTGPGGVLVISPKGKLLGHIRTGQRTANCAWGNDGSVLYMTADALLVRVQTLTKGAGW
jgi:gluconolactonase